MNDYIDRQKLLKDIEQYHLSDGKFQHWVEVQPSADVQPVRHGRWEIYQLAELGQAWTVQCSVCHAIGFHGKTPYCCECGARMDGEKE